MSRRHPKMRSYGHPGRLSARGLRRRLADMENNFNPPGKHRARLVKGVWHDAMCSCHGCRVAKGWEL